MEEKTTLELVLGALTVLSIVITYLFNRIVSLSRSVGKLEGAEFATNAMCEKTLETVDRAIREKNKQ